MNKYFIGIDGGGTKTDFLLTNQSGQVISRHQEGSSSYLSIGIDGLCSVIKAGVDAVLKLANLKLSQVHSMAIGVPSYGEIEFDKTKIDHSLPSLFPDLNIYIANDVELGFYSGLAGQAGINLVAGTGSIGYGVDPSGQSARVGGWGETVGDDGAGYWIGQKFLNAFTKMADGRLERTLMYDQLKSQLNIMRDLSILDHVYVSHPSRRTQIASFSSICNQMAQKGDPKCLAILQESAKELSLHIRSLKDKLNFIPEQTTVKVTYSGSVFKSKIILQELQHLLGPDYEFHPPKADPVFGAILLAQKHYTQVASGLDN